MPYLELQGIRLFYERQGDGNPPLVHIDCPGEIYLH